MADFIIKKNDLLPTLDAYLKDADGKVVDLTDASSVAFTMQEQDEATLKINKQAVQIVSPPDGHVRYIWVSGDTDIAGTFFGEFEVLWGTKPQTFPNKGFIVIEIIEDLA